MEVKAGAIIFLWVFESAAAFAPIYAVFSFAKRKNNQLHYQKCRGERLLIWFAVSAHAIPEEHFGNDGNYYTHEHTRQDIEQYSVNACYDI